MCELSKVVRGGPSPRLDLDQWHCTVDTKLRRVLAFHEAGALIGRRVLLLGDDDLTALALALCVRRHGSPSTIASLTVVDVDPRLVSFLERELAGAPFAATCIEHDLRRPLPRELVGAFDTVVTDPPYTTQAARLFLSRAANALEGRHGDVFLSYGSRRPGAGVQLQRVISEIGFVIQRLSRDFNEYVGAGVLGGTSHLYHLAATDELGDHGNVRRAALHRWLDLALEGVAKVGLARGGSALGVEEAAPRLLLVPDGAELPDAEGGAVRPLERPGMETGRVAVFRPDGLPKLVVVAPGRDEEEVEALAAAVQDDEAEVVVEGNRSGIDGPA